MVKKKIRILYVEDEPFLGKIVKESLEHRHFEVHMIQDGLHAVTAFLQYSPDICILDVMLPNKDGFTISKEIRQLNDRIPIIFLTAKVQTDDLIKGFEFGGNDYIRKPFSVKELIVRINNLLTLSGDKSSSKNNNAFPIGTFTFLPGKHELHWNDQIKKLSHRETQLIQILYNNRNQVLDRRIILRQIWGDDNFYNSRNLDVYITKIRSYIKADDNLKIITLKGLGYHFVC